MTDTTDRAPWCPMTGHAMVSLADHTRYGEPLLLVRCYACGFGDGETFTSRDKANAHARRLIRAELARQALEMRASTFAREDGVCSLECTMTNALDDYIRLGAHPLRLPGEGA